MAAVAAVYSFTHLSGSCCHSMVPGCPRTGCPSEVPRMAWQSCITLPLSQPQKSHNVHFPHYHTPAQTPWEQLQNWPLGKVMSNHMIRRVHRKGDMETALENTIFSLEMIQLFGTPGFYYLPWSTLFSITYYIKLLLKT